MDSADGKRLSGVFTVQLCMLNGSAAAMSVQLSALGSEVYRNEENLQELPRVVTCLIPRSSPCSMNKVDTH